MTRRGAVEVGFVLLGFFAFLMAIATTQVMFWGGGVWFHGGFLDAVKALAPGAILAAFGWALVAWRGKLATSFFPEEDEPGGAHASTDWQESAYRLGFAMLGVLTLSRWVTGAFVTLMMLLDSLRASSSRVFPESPLDRMEPFHWRGLFASAATFAVGVYLLLGAPGLRGWLVRRARGESEASAPESVTDGNG